MHFAGKPVTYSRHRKGALFCDSAVQLVCMLLYSILLDLQMEHQTLASSAVFFQANHQTACMTAYCICA